MMLTTSQAAKFLGNKDSSSIRHIIRRGKLQAKKFGGVWMISRKDLDKYMLTSSRKRD